MQNGYLFENDITGTLSDNVLLWARCGRIYQSQNNGACFVYGCGEVLGEEQGHLSMSPAGCLEWLTDRLLEVQDEDDLSDICR